MFFFVSNILDVFFTLPTTPLKTSKSSTTYLFSRPINHRREYSGQYHTSITTEYSFGFGCCLFVLACKFHFISFCFIGLLPRSIVVIDTWLGVIFSCSIPVLKWKCVVWWMPLTLGNLHEGVKCALNMLKFLCKLAADMKGITQFMSAFHVLEFYQQQHWLVAIFVEICQIKSEDRQIY